MKNAEGFWRGMGKEQRIDFLVEVLGLPALNARAVAGEFWVQVPEHLKKEIAESMADAGFAADWQNETTANRQSKIEALGYTPAMAKQWAKPANFSALPEEVRQQFATQSPDKGLYRELPVGTKVKDWRGQTGTVKQHGTVPNGPLDIPGFLVAWDGGPEEWSPRHGLYKFASSPAQFADYVKEVSFRLKSGAVESDVVAYLKAQGCDENQRREILQAARSYESREVQYGAGNRMKPGGSINAKTFAADAPLPSQLHSNKVNEVLTNPAKFASKTQGQEIVDAYYAVEASRATPLDEDEMIEAIVARTGISEGLVKNILVQAKIFSGVSAGLATAANAKALTPPELNKDTSGQFNVSLPTEDGGKEDKQFDSAESAVKYAAEKGFVHDTGRAVSRLNATGKWSAVGGAAITFGGPGSGPQGGGLVRVEQEGFDKNAPDPRKAATENTKQPEKLPPRPKG